MAFERTRRSHREVNVGSESVMGRKLAPKEVCHRFLVRSGRPSVLMLIQSLIRCAGRECYLQQPPRRHRVCLGFPLE